MKTLPSIAVLSTLLIAAISQATRPSNDNSVADIAEARSVAPGSRVPRFLQGSGTKKVAGAIFSDEFVAHDSQKWVRSSKPNTDAAFKNTAWSTGNVAVSYGLTLTLKGCRPFQDCAKPKRPYVGAEYQAVPEIFHYGQYWVRMKAAKGPGIVTGFFTYAGNPWDEIDIEILGNKTDHMQVNYFSQGKPLCDPDKYPTWTPGCGQPMVKLGFDAAERLHDYMVDWQQTRIRWWVYDDISSQQIIDEKPWKLRYEATGQKPNEPATGLPVTKGKIMLNLWASCSKNWTGLCTFKPPVSAYFDRVRYTNYGPNYDPNGFDPQPID